MRPFLPGTLLRLEGLALLIGCLLVYSRLHASWWLLLLLLLAPDLFILGYLVNARTGAALYNAVHTSLFPLLLGLAAFWSDHPLLLAVCVIWLAHIGMDRMLCYGLKYQTGFRDTHLQRV